MPASRPIFSLDHHASPIYHLIAASPHSPIAAASPGALLRLSFTNSLSGDPLSLISSHSCHPSSLPKSGVTSFHPLPRTATSLSSISYHQECVAGASSSPFFDSLCSHHVVTTPHPLTTSCITKTCQQRFRQLDSSPLHTLAGRSVSLGRYQVAACYDLEDKKRSFVGTLNLKMTLAQVRNASLPCMNLIRMTAVPILEQLYLEEKLLRTSAENWCIVNHGTNHPTIVMGISGRPSELIELKSVLRDQIPIIRRFTGGGTVIVDGGTIFVSFICNKNAIPGLQPYPHPIMSWSAQLYSDVLSGFGDFHLRENDYAFNSRKFGGNAQSIIKERWIHHTSFLWDYDVKNMEYLKLPARAPRYRSARSHVEFLCRMKDYIPSRSTFVERTIKSLGSYFSVRPFRPDEIAIPSSTLLGSTKLLTRQELENAYASQCEDLR
ncbi:hypothetical protein Cni_G06292 [Canna indica]|uniref:BPL/LPL catalytic domain-containing protein n=1 Tax=Canna indica TaxID=4628 RepID=A0AAQ3Q6D4_9LILI|nr:hypothetical protein Cni_G06292 [Canna indica]